MATVRKRLTRLAAAGCCPAGAARRGHRVPPLPTCLPEKIQTNLWGEIRGPLSPFSPIRGEEPAPLGGPDTSIAVSRQHTSPTHERMKGDKRATADTQIKRRRIPATCVFFALRANQLPLEHRWNKSCNLSPSPLSRAPSVKRRCDLSEHSPGKREESVVEQPGDFATGDRCWRGGAGIFVARGADGTTGEGGRVGEGGREGECKVTLQSPGACFLRWRKKRDPVVS